MRLIEEGNAGWPTLFSPAGVTGSSTQNDPSTSIDWGAASPCNGSDSSESFLSALGRLLAFFPCFFPSFG